MFPGGSAGRSRVGSGGVKTQSARIDGLGTTIFAEMSALALRTGSVNLGQGFPDTDGPGSVVEAAVARHAPRAQPVRARRRRARAA